MGCGGLVNGSERKMYLNQDKEGEKRACTYGNLLQCTLCSKLVKGKILEHPVALSAKEGERERERRADQQIIPLVKWTIAAASILIAIILLISSDDRVKRVGRPMMFKRMNNTREALMTTVVVEPYEG
jgi:hypothetical protein